MNEMTESASAVAVAERGWSSSTAISPKKVPTPSRESTRVSVSLTTAEISTLPVSTTYKPSPTSPCLKMICPARKGRLRAVRLTSCNSAASREMNEPVDGRSIIGEM